MRRKLIPLCTILLVLLVASSVLASAYIGNKNSRKFHYASCPSVSDMKEHNKVELESREEAISRGFVPCKRCRP